MGNKGCCGCNPRNANNPKHNTHSRKHKLPQNNNEASNVYKHRSTDCNKRDYNECDCFHRLQNAMQYFSFLDIRNNPSNIELFLKFCNETYKQLTNDYIHVINTHGNELETINGKSPKCDQSQCSSVQRHHDRNNWNSELNMHVQDNPMLIFYLNIFDNIHNWIFHIYDFGMRAEQIDDSDWIEQENSDDVDHYFDHRFARISKQIAVKRQKWKEEGISLSRLESGDKYHLTMNATMSDISSNASFIDEVLLYLEQNRTPSILCDITDDLYQFLVVQEYDTDAMIQDVEDMNNCNIAMSINNESYMQYLIQHIENSRGM